MTIAQKKPSRAVQHKIANRVTGDSESKSKINKERKLSVVLRDIVRHR